MHAAKTPKLQRKCDCEGSAGSCGCDAKKKLRRKGNDGASSLSAIPAEVHHAVAGSGAGLDPATRTLMESRFDHDFSSVRIHTNAQAAASVDAVDARAYTFGDDIAFASGAYAPSTDTGRRLLAHELAHVVQQQSGTALQTSSDISTPGDAGELEADRAADAVMSGATPRIARGTGAALQLRRLVRNCTSPNARACVIHLHPNEQNAYFAAQQIQREYCVNFVSLGPGADRLIDVSGVGRFNPNRIFTNDPRLLRCHAFGGRAVSDATVQALIAWRDTTLAPAINACTGGTGGAGGAAWTASLPVVAMHNNTPNALDINTFQTPGTAATAWSCLGDTAVANRTADPAVASNPATLTRATARIPGREDPDNFVLATRAQDFPTTTGTAPAARTTGLQGFNVVAQDPTVRSTNNPANDASLSAAMATSQYFNIEAEGKPFQSARYAFNLEMARDVMGYLGIPRRPANAGTCEDGTHPVPATSPAACPATQPQPQPTTGTPSTTAPTTGTGTTSAAPPVRTRPANVPSICPFYSSQQMLIDARDEWRDRLNRAALDATTGHVTPAAARWLIGLPGTSPLNPPPGPEATRMRECMFSTMRASRGTGTPPLSPERVLMRRMHRSYESQRDAIWNRKWAFRGEPFDRITQDAIDHATIQDPTCGSALTLNGQWDPGNPAHRTCWNTLPVDLKARQIMQATSAPGISRHHYGTDFDFQELNAAPWSSGAWVDEAAWLSDNAKFFGFLQSFRQTPGPTEARYMPEPWHWSYWPAAQAIVDFTLAHDADIENALVAQWATEGTVAAGDRVPEQFRFALANWRRFVANVDTAAPTF